ncbi:MAG TPA: PQQ-binding-like beta-propeller repeat protein [Ktedonobacterales bacterium]
MRFLLRRHMRVVIALCLALALAAAFAAPKVIQASGATITDFSPASGPARTVVAVHGSGLIFTNGVTIGGVSARWRVHSTSWIDVLVPDTAPSGPIAITSMGGGATSATNFTVTPGVLLNPSPPPSLVGPMRVPPAPSASPAGIVTAQGSGFAPGETINLALDATGLGAATADANGAFSATTLVVPDQTTLGAHQVNATGATSASTAQASLQLIPSWPQFGMDAAHTGTNSVETVISIANANTLRFKWQATIPEGFKLDAEPTVADGNVFVSAHPCYLYAFAVDTGALRWEYKMQLSGVTCTLTPTGPGVGHSTPTVAHGMVFAPYGGAIWALNDQTGAFLWHTTQAGYTEVTYADGRLYTTDGVNVYALDLATGGVLWTWTSGVSTALAGNPAIAVDQGRVWVVHALGLLTALDGATGAFIRSVQLAPQSNNVGPGPTIANATVWVALPGANANPLNARSALYAIDASTGAIKFSTFTVMGAVFAPLAVDPTGVYTCGYQAYLQAYNLPSYAVRWTSPFHCGYRSALRVVHSSGVNNDTGFAVSSALPFEASLAILNMATGSGIAGGPFTEYGADGASTSIVNGVWYVGSMESLGGGKYASSVYAAAPLGTF